MMPIEIVWEGENHKFSLKEGPQTVGRSSENDVQIPMARVSKRHAEIRVEGERIMVRDLGSRNGTELNGQPIGETWMEVPVGSLVSFAGAIMRRASPATTAAHRLLGDHQVSARRCSGHRVKIEPPQAGLVHARLLGLTRKGDSHRCPDCVPAPYRDGDVALQHGMVGERRRQFDIGEARKGQKGEQGDEAGAMAGVHGGWRIITHNPGARNRHLLPFLTSVCLAAPCFTTAFISG